MQPACFPSPNKCSMVLNLETGLHLSTVLQPGVSQVNFALCSETKIKVRALFLTVGGLAPVNLYIALYVTDLLRAITNSRKWAVRLLRAPGKRSE